MVPVYGLLPTSYTSEALRQAAAKAETGAVELPILVSFRKLAYLAAPYSGGGGRETRDKRFNDITTAAAWLINSSYSSNTTVISPITHNHKIEEILGVFDGGSPSGEFWYNYDASILFRCDVLWVLCLPGWEASKGVAIEISIAQQTGKPIYYFNYHEGKEPLVTLNIEMKNG